MYEFLIFVVCAAQLSVVLTLSWLSQHYMLSTITWTVQIMYVRPCLLGLTAFSLFHSDRPCFTPINWYNSLKHNVLKKFIYHTFSSWRGPQWCRLFAGDSVDTWRNIQSSFFIRRLLQTRGSVAGLYSWQMPVFGRKTKNIHISGKWINFYGFLSCSTVLKLVIAKYNTRRKHIHCRYISL